MSAINESIAANLLPRAFEQGGTGQELFLYIHHTLTVGNPLTPSQLDYLQKAFSRVVTENLPPNEAFGLLGKSGNNKPLFADVLDFTDEDIRQMIICTRFEIIGRSGERGTRREEKIMNEFAINSRQTLHNIRKRQREYVDSLQSESELDLNDAIERLTKELNSQS